MIADLKPYAEYKESGLSWLGQVPWHWEMRTAFGAFVPNHERNHGMKKKTVLSLSYGRIVTKPVEKLHGLVPESFETYQIVNPVDIVLRTTDLQNDHTSLRVGMVRDREIITSAYLALRAMKGMNPDFGFQFLNVWDSTKRSMATDQAFARTLTFLTSRECLSRCRHQTSRRRLCGFWTGRMGDWSGRSGRSGR